MALPPRTGVPASESNGDSGGKDGAAEVTRCSTYSLKLKLSAGAASAIKINHTHTCNQQGDITE